MTFERVIGLFRRVGSNGVTFMAARPDGTAVRLSQHDMVDAGFATYQPFPYASDSDASISELRAAFLSLAWSPLPVDC